MKKKFIIFLLFLLFKSSVHANDKYNIGLLVMATGRYIEFVKPLIESAEKYFCKNHKVTYFIFTDDKNFKHKDAVITYQAKLGWPYDTMMRFETYYKNKEKFKSMDYLYACDADMLFVGDVGDEIISNLVGTFHPGFYMRTLEKPYERNEISKACIKDDGDYYFAGGFFGGSNSEIVKLIETTSKNITYDLNRHNYVAKWHDESHLNRYFIDNKPTKMLLPSYCYPEDVDAIDDYVNIINLPRKLIALAKKHHQFRKYLFK